MNNLPFKYPEMEDLPDRHVQRARPFEHVGIDYFGPLTVKERDETVKAHGTIMTCTVTRLLHLELVSDMTTANLLNALRRFFARRGVPTSITSALISSRRAGCCTAGHQRQILCQRHGYKENHVEDNHASRSVAGSFL
ncbi:hypothetical protein RB195_022540 [Necator americanus]|uniref:Uncharacterized protein n=1 Tax=Necator americanus TaxID=51031 RepID=A0ABR1EHW0_NECAM